MRATWRDQIRPIVAEIIEHYGTEDMKLLRKKLVEHRPGWAEASWMLKVWRDEVNDQLGIKAARERAKKQALFEASGQKSFAFD